MPLSTSIATIYTTSDGQQFINQLEAERHESDLQVNQRLHSKFDSLRRYLVIHGFDADEGKGHFKRTLIFTDMALPIVLQWCFSWLGAPIRQWYGNDTYTEWLLYLPNDPETNEASIEFNKGLYNQTNNKDYITRNIVIISQTDFSSIEKPKSELPQPIRSGSFPRFKINGR